MKFVIAWTVRDKSAEGTKNLLAAYEAWTPPPGITEMLSRADGQGGGLIIETDDVNVLVNSIAPFTQWLDYNIDPVVDVTTVVDALKATL